MNIMRLPMTRHLLTYVKIINNIQKLKTCMSHIGSYSTISLDPITTEILFRNKNRNPAVNDVPDLQLCTKTSAINISIMTNTEIDEMFTELIAKNKEKQIDTLLSECQQHRKYLSLATLKKIFRHFSQNGKPEIILTLQNYCNKIDPMSYKRNGEFLHYLAKAECMRGNSDKGLSILKSIYCKYDSLRSFYRIIFRDLIQDSVLNRSEASLVVFKRYVLEFSEELSDHYPLVCFWHICWSSTWFSDQMLSNELLETSEALQTILKDKASAFSITALKDFNEDAVVRLLQILLKYDMMTEYVAVLQILFSYKLRNRDMRGCTEIIRNCEVLGVSLPSSQQGKYITMLILGKKPKPEELPTKTPYKHFKLKF